MEKMKKGSNIPLKIFSLVLAFVLWSYVAYQDETVRTTWVKDVPITVVGSDSLSEAGYYVTGTSRTSIDVKLMGNRTALSRVKSDDITVVLDVSDIRREGETAVICEVTAAPNNIDVVSTRHGTVTVSAEEIITDIYPISARIVGSPAEGYSIFDPSLSYSEVSVRGPKSVISLISSVATKSVSVSGVTQSGSVAVGLTAYDAEGNSLSGVTFEPSTVDVAYSILREKTVPLKISLTNIPIDKNVSYSPTSIKVYGSADALSTVDTVTSAPLDVSGAENGDVLSASLNVPSGVRLQTEDNAIEVTVSVEKLANDNKNEVLPNE